MQAGAWTCASAMARLFDDGSFHETGGLAGKGSYGDEGELPDFLPANMVSGKGRIDGRRAVVQGDDFRSAAVPPTRPSGRRWSTLSAWRMICARRSCAGRRHRRGRQREEPRGHGLHLRAVRARLRADGSQPLAGARGGGRAGPRGRPGRGARGGLAFLGHRQGSARCVAARRWPRPWRVARQGGARRRRAQAKAGGWTTSRPTRTTRWISSSASSSCPPALEPAPTAAATDPPTGARTSCSHRPRDGEARRHPPHPGAGFDAGSVFEMGRFYGRSLIVGPGPPGRPPGRRHGLDPKTTAAA